jgi:hypothetical protein
VTQLVEITQDKIALTWPFILEHIRDVAASSRGKLTADDLFHLCSAGYVTPFVVLDDGGNLLATALVEFAQYPRKKVCRIIGCVGSDRAKWLHHLSGIHAWARAHGCQAMQVIARKGWARELTAYRMTHVLLELDLNEDQAQSAA